MKVTTYELSACQLVEGGLLQKYTGFDELNLITFIFVVFIIKH